MEEEPPDAVDIMTIPPGVCEEVATRGGRVGEGTGVRTEEEEPPDVVDIKSVPPNGHNYPRSIPLDDVLSTYRDVPDHTVPRRNDVYVPPRDVPYTHRGVPCAKLPLR